MKPRTKSAGLWLLAWRRLLADRVAVVSMVVVGLFLVMMAASGLNLIAAHWNEEVAVGYAPPAFLGAAKRAAAATVQHAGNEPNAYPGTVKDPLATEIAELRAQIAGSATPAGPEGELSIDGIKVVDPLATEMAEILGSTKAVEEKRELADALPFGADKWGRDVVSKTIKGSETSIFVGLTAALVAVVIGTVLGAFAGYYGGKVDDFFNWFYSVFTAIPYMLLILAIAAVLNQRGVMAVVLILGLTGWTGIYRLVRAEYLKHKSREYVQAADAIGASNRRRMFVHIFPNISHVSLVQLSVNTVGFIKSEVILSFLGFGVPVDKVSWGSMLNEAQNELILGYWWQLVAATIAMALLVTAFSMFTDALRDALDPKIK
ncbi:MAG TPA: ABC transporter permease [Rhodocyclaceae bacterium]|nr:ABC transporter permease [Rhodocyclaceae bacterium]